MPIRLRVRQRRRLLRPYRRVLLFDLGLNMSIAGPRIRLARAVERSLDGRDIVILERAVAADQGGHVEFQPDQIMEGRERLGHGVVIVTDRVGERSQRGVFGSVGSRDECLGWPVSSRPCIAVSKNAGVYVKFGVSNIVADA